ncbi:hypothetical protein BN14_06028 [Rhizoctonia solani AG-1 IB]|uniref:Uncharacterized protein n=1 Tax=Thanatephorus cucumeris (strain AG1-IB / isolate 7/3/14) TaxID=1108050 RepID=M5BXR8_THACB|nr:hypothetical protein BN14_06028 [Rhizoctonia solani AG-1 IB]
MPVPILTDIPEDITANQWVFRCLMFYAEPLEDQSTTGINMWSMQIAQLNIKTEEWRFLRLLRGVEGKEIISVKIVQEDRIHEGKVAELKFWVTPTFITNKLKQSERVEYTHIDLMRHLRDPRIQENYLSASINGPNFVSLMVELNLIAPDSISVLVSKMSKAYADYNVPIRTPQSAAK